MHANEPLSLAKAEVEKSLNYLKPRVFTAETELTFIMRKPGDEKCELVISNDSLEEVQKVIERMIRRRNGE